MSNIDGYLAFHPDRLDAIPGTSALIRTRKLTETSRSRTCYRSILVESARSGNSTVPLLDTTTLHAEASVELAVAGA